jgi:hypothetical protein
MGKTYTCTIPLKVRKEHTCVGCGAVYSYLLERKITGSSANKTAAENLAKKNFDRALAQETDLQPCPSCGLYQPDMIGQRRVKGHRATFWLGIIALAVLVILRATDVFNAHTAAYVIAGACLLIALVHTGNDRKNPNADVQANRQLATERTSSSSLRLTAPGRADMPAEHFINPPRSLTHRLALPLLFAAVLLAVSPEIFRTVRHWPLNPSFYPPVAGPGDSTRFYMPQSISSIKSYWRGTPDVALTPEGSTDEIQVAAKANQNDWGHSISAKSSETRSTSHPWLELTIPNDAKLANKTAQADMILEVQYPELADSSSFVTKHQVMHEKAAMHLAAAHAGHEYNSLWWEGASLAALLVIAGSVFLTSAAKGMRTRAIPTRVLSADAAPAPPAGARPAATV